MYYSPPHHQPIPTVPPSNIVVDPTGAKVFLIALDGADWRAINPLLKQGKLPTLQRLMDEGVYASTIPSSSALSPVAWTTILTGKNYEQHRITGFLTNTLFSRYPLTPIIPSMGGVGSYKLLQSALQKVGIIKVLPFTSDLRRTKTVWNILSEQDHDSLIVGYWATWPAETINGIIITDYFWPVETEASKEITDSQLGSRRDVMLFPHLTYPESIATELKDSIITSDDITDEELSQMNLDRERMWFYSKDKTFLSVTKNLLSEHQPRFSTVYLEGIDVSMTYYWKDHILAGEEQEKNTIYENTIDNYYQHIDQQINELLQAVDDDTTIIIMSENGNDFDYSLEAKRPEGIFIMKGPNIKDADMINDIDTVDVTPTLLYLFGFPIAEDMPGNIISEGISETFIKTHPTRSITTYETTTEKSKQITAVPVEKKVQEQLRSLGYIS